MADSLEDLRKEMEASLTFLDNTLLSPSTAQRLAVPAYAAPPTLEEVEEESLPVPPPAPTLLGIPKRNSIISASDTHIIRFDQLDVPTARPGDTVPKSQTDLSNSANGRLLSATSKHPSVSTDSQIMDKDRRGGSSQKDVSSSRLSELTKSLMAMGRRRSSVQNANEATSKTTLPAAPSNGEDYGDAGGMSLDDIHGDSGSEGTERLEPEMDFSDYRFPFVFDRTVLTGGGSKDLLGSPFASTYTANSSKKEGVSGGSKTPEFDAYLPLGKLKRGFLPPPNVQVPIRILITKQAL
jgi:hypothetical protein